MYEYKMFPCTYLLLRRILKRALRKTLSLKLKYSVNPFLFPSEG
jgi:hypothetical protein